jgi:glutathione peroxidase
MNIYDFSVLDAQGNTIDLKQYANKVVLIVNTATHCGYTPQYDDLQKLYAKYESKGFEILDFPCNQFGGQAPEGIEEYVGICQTKFHVQFKIFDKVIVNGPKTHPLYEFLKQGTNIRWNFTKFLIDRKGNLVKRFDSKDAPFSFEQDIINLL